MSPVLYDRYGRPIDFADGRTFEKGEIAAVGTVVSESAEIWNPDATVKKKGFAHLRGMEDANGYIYGFLRTRVKAVSGRPWKVVSGSETDRDIEIAEFVREALEGMDGSLRDDIEEICEGIKFGYAVHELVWDWVEMPGFGLKVAPLRIAQKTQEDFRFRVDAKGNVTALTQKQRPDVGLPIDKFVIARYGGGAGNPYGKGELSRLYWHDWFMREGWKFWAIGLERYGMPLAVAKIPRGTDQATRTAIDDMLKSLQSHSGVQIPEDVELDLLEAVRGGRATFGEFIASQKEPIAIVILGSTLTATVGESGSRALGEVHEETKSEVVESDVGWLETIMDEQVVRRIVDYNYAVVEVYPTFRLPKPEVGDPMMLAARMREAQALGMAVPTKYAYECLHIPMPEKGEEVLEPKPAFQPPLAFGEPRKGRERKAFGEEGAEEPFWREFFADEDGAGIRRMYRATNALVDASMEESRGIWTDIRESLIGQVEKAGAIEAGRVDTELSVSTTKLQDMVFRQSLAANVNGRIAAMRELERLGGAASGERKAFDGRHFIESTLIEELLPAEEARNLFAVRATVSDAEWNRLTKAARQLAFFVSTTQGSEAVKRVRIALNEAIGNGKDLAWFRRRIEAEFAELWIGDVFGVGTVAAADARVATVYRTNVMSALNRGRDAIFAAAEDPSGPDPIVAYRYSAVMDSRTRATHAAMDGRIYRADDPIWEEWNPPNGYNCRCIRIPILTSMAARMDRDALSIEAALLDGEPVHPDKDFGKEIFGQSLEGGLGDVYRFSEALRAHVGGGRGKWAHGPRASARTVRPYGGM